MAVAAAAAEAKLSAALAAKEARAAAARRAKARIRGEASPEKPERYGAALRRPRRGRESRARGFGRATHTTRVQGLNSLGAKGGVDGRRTATTVASRAATRAARIATPTVGCHRATPRVRCGAVCGATSSRRRGGAARPYTRTARTRNRRPSRRGDRERAASRWNARDLRACVPVDRPREETKRARSRSAARRRRAKRAPTRKARAQSGSRVGARRRSERHHRLGVRRGELLRVRERRRAVPARRTVAPVARALVRGCAEARARAARLDPSQGARGVQARRGRGGMSTSVEIADWLVIRRRFARSQKNRHSNGDVGAVALATNYR